MHVAQRVCPHFTLTLLCVSSSQGDGAAGTHRAFLRLILNICRINFLCVSIEWESASLPPTTRILFHLAVLLEWLKVRTLWHFLLWHIMKCIKRMVEQCCGCDLFSLQAAYALVLLRHTPSQQWQDALYEAAATHMRNHKQQAKQQLRLYNLLHHQQGERQQQQQPRRQPQEEQQRQQQEAQQGPQQGFQQEQQQQLMEAGAELQRVYEDGIAGYGCFNQSELRLLFWAAWSWGFRSSHPVGKLGFYAVRQLQRARREDKECRNWWVIGAPAVGGRWRLGRWRRRRQQQWEKKTRVKVLRGLSGGRGRVMGSGGGGGGGGKQQQHMHGRGLGM